jgi:hypothetical protein
MKLGRIQQIELRDIWKHEATNFTKWLAKPENLDLLSEEIDIELNLIDTEYNVVNRPLKLGPSLQVRVGLPFLGE